MENIYLLLIVGLGFWYFIYLRKVSEMARFHMKRYCQQEGLQFLSLARVSSRFRFNPKYGPHILSVFDVEFSGDGESQYTGKLSLRGYKLESVDLPAYRI